MIDTLQRIRASEESLYSSDYRELSVLKALSQKLNICIVLIHHIRKIKENDSFNMISGSTIVIKLIIHYSVDNNLIMCYNVERKVKSK